jgi:hypothetical protein
MFKFSGPQVIVMAIDPATLFMDIKESIVSARLTTRRGLAFEYLRRGPRRTRRVDYRTTQAPYYNFSLAKLDAALQAGGHPEARPPQAPTT